MGLYSNSLLASLSQYRKRKRIALDGSVAGMEYNRYRPGIRPASHHIQLPTGHASAPADYDPVESAYDSAGPGYTPPAAWFEGMPSSASRPTSEMRFAGHVPEPGLSPGQVEYEQSLLTPELMGQLLEEISPGSAHTNVGDLVEAAVAEPADSSTSAPAPDQLESPLEAMLDEPRDPYQQEITDAVEQAQMEHSAAMEEMYEQQAVPEQPDPYQQAVQMYDEQMEQLMNPFAMPGMGFGPGP